MFGEGLPIARVRAELSWNLRRGGSMQSRLIPLMKLVLIVAATCLVVVYFG
jgi:hypothetical protein